MNASSSPSVQKCVWVLQHSQLIFLKEALTWNAPRAKTQSFQFIPNVSSYAIQVWVFVKKLQSVYFVHSHSILRSFMKMSITDTAYT